MFAVGCRPVMLQFTMSTLSISFVHSFFYVEITLFLIFMLNVLCDYDININGYH